jgi:hypothetical protein
MTDVEICRASIDGTLDLELHAVSRNRKVADRARDTEAGSAPRARAIGRASRKLPLSDGTEVRADTGRLGPLGRTPLGAAAHGTASVTVSERRSGARCQRARRPTSSTSNPVEGEVMTPRSGGDSRAPILESRAVAVQSSCLERDGMHVRARHLVPRGDPLIARA